MEYKVPQNIEVEDRVVGPLTLRQFFILMGGGMVCLVLYIFLSFFKPLFYMLSIIVMGLAAGLAFGNYGDQHPEKIFLSALSSFTTPKKRVWKRVVDERELKEVSHQQTGAPQKTGAELAAKKPEVDFDRLSKIIDTGSFTDEEVKGKIANLGEKRKIAESSSPQDIISASPNVNHGVDELLSKIGKGAKKGESLISQLASVSPAKFFKYEQIDKTGAIVEPMSSGQPDNKS